MDAFDADVLIYAAAQGHPLGRRVLTLFDDRGPASAGRLAGGAVGVGSVLLITEVLTKPVRGEQEEELIRLTRLLGRLELRPIDVATASVAVALGASYGLKTVDAVHLATAVNAGADRFITNNRRDFPVTIGEIDITYPTDLPEAEDGTVTR